MIITVNTFSYTQDQYSTFLYVHHGFTVRAYSVPQFSFTCEQFTISCMVTTNVASSSFFMFSQHVQSHSISLNLRTQNQFSIQLIISQTTWNNKFLTKICRSTVFVKRSLLTFVCTYVHCKNKIAVLANCLLRDYPSCANSKNVVVVKHYVGGQYQLPLQEFSISSITFIKLHSHAIALTKCLAKTSVMILSSRGEPERAAH